MELTVDIPIEPIGQGRPRVTWQHGRVWTYYRDAVQEAKDAIKTFLLPYNGKGFAANVPLALTITTYRHRSPYRPKRELLPFRRSDLDNEIKLVIDAMNGILFPDDAAITSIIARKRYTDKPDNLGHIVVSLTEDA